MAIEDISVGTDLVEVSRISKLIKKFGQKFFDRILSKDEIEYCKKSSLVALHFAARFSAKEAFAKAMGCKIGKPVKWKDMSILVKESGEPYFEFSETLKTYMIDRGFRCAKLSITHTETLAQAVVILIR